ncbi:MAG TPA: hypothetical protein VM658_19390 [bacterium]|nr:hypothetical protein [bacterium]
MPRICQVCGKEIPDHIKGNFCSRECFQAGKAGAASGAVPKAAPAKTAPAPAAAPAAKPAPASAAPKSAIVARPAPPSAPGRIQPPSPAPRVQPPPPAAAPSPPLAAQGEASPDLGRGAYRKDPRRYAGVIVSVRKRKIDFEHEVEEWGIKNPLGGTIFVEKGQIELGEPEAASPQPAPAAPAPARPVVPVLYKRPAPPAVEGTPMAVKVLAWIWIALGIMMVLSSVMALFMSSMMNSMMAHDGMSMADANVPAIFRYYRLLVFLQFLVAAFIIFAAYNFLMLRAWGRTAIEVINWLGLGYILGFGIYWLISWANMSSKFPAGHGPPAGFAALGIVMGILVFVTLGVPLGVMIHFLRSAPVRAAMSR